MAQMPLIIGRFFGCFFKSISSIRNYQKALDAARRSPLMADGLQDDFQDKGSLIHPHKPIGSGFWVHRFPLRVEGLTIFLEPLNPKPLNPDP